MAGDLRIGGIASGIDTQGLIDQLMRAERMPLDRMQQRRQTLEWQRDQYREINTKMLEFSNYIFDNMLLESKFIKSKAISSNETAVSAKAISASGSATYTIEVHNLATASNWISDPVNWSPPAEDLTLSFSYKKPGSAKATDVTIDISSTDTLNDVITKINRSGLGVSVMLDDHTQQIVMTAKDTGAGAELKINDEATADFFQSLGFVGADAGEVLNTTNPGENAKFKINGLATERTSNTFRINGLEFTLKEVTNEPVRVETDYDVDAMVDHVLEFIEKYNELIDTIHGKVTEERFRSYAPLTEEQKKAMEEKEIELWEEKAKSGLLRNDSLLTGALSNIRTSMYSEVSAKNININAMYNQLSEIGIVTSSNYMDGGKLYLDTEKRGKDQLTGEERLRKALSEDPYAVFSFFAADGDSTEEKGVARRVRETVVSTMKSIEEKAGNQNSTLQNFSIGKLLLNVNKQIDSFEQKLMDLEDRYWKQFTAMEKALQKLNEQSSYLMSQLGMNMAQQ